MEETLNYILDEYKEQLKQYENSIKLRIKKARFDIDTEEEWSEYMVDYAYISAAIYSINKKIEELDEEREKIINEFSENSLSYEQIEAAEKCCVIDEQIEKLERVKKEFSKKYKKMKPKIAKINKCIDKNIKVINHKTINR